MDFELKFQDLGSLLNAIGYSILFELVAHRLDVPGGKVSFDPTV
jgi:hypothetical protein